MLWKRWELMCSALLSAEAILNRCDVTGGTCFGDSSWLLSDVRRILSPHRRVLGGGAAGCGMAGAADGSQRRGRRGLLDLEGGECSQGRSQTMLRRQEGAPVWLNVQQTKNGRESQLSKLAVTDRTVLAQTRD